MTVVGSSTARAYRGSLARRVLKARARRSDDPHVIVAYRNRLMAAFFVAAGVYGAAMMLFILAFAQLDAADTVEVGLGLGCSVWSIARLSRCGVYADDDGIRILNPLTSTRLRWEEIARFTHEDRGACRAERVDGSAVKIFGVQEPTWSPRRSGATRAAVLIDRLNLRL